MEDDKETAELQMLVKIIPDEEEVAVDAIPLATKPPVIVDYKIHKEEKTSYNKITRADRSSKMLTIEMNYVISFLSSLQNSRGMNEVFGKHPLVLLKLLLLKLKLKVNTAQAQVNTVKVRVTAAKQNLVLFSNLDEKYAK
ncbi:hypothetical protein Tco_0796158 [Tanacetum coccineum]